MVNYFFYSLFDLFRSQQYLLVTESDYIKTHFIQSLRPDQIVLMLLPFGMIASIYLYNEIVIGQQEIYDIISDDMLPKYLSSDSLTFKPFPKLFFCQRRILAILSGKTLTAHTYPALLSDISTYLINPI